MSIKLNIEPRVVMSWSEFQDKKPPFSIALDGYINEPTQRNAVGPYANFDHHTGVDRISTRSTAEQIHMEINLGLFDTFKNKGKAWANIFVNDCDEDTVLSVWLLQNHERVRSHAEPLINKLVYCSDRMDCTAGTYPFGDVAQLRRMAWMFEPYRSARSEGKVGTLTPAGMQTIFDAILHRITLYSLGEGCETSLEGSYKVIGGGPGWSLVTEHGPGARMYMFASGVNAFVSIVSPGRYVIGRKSTWTPFPLEKIYGVLNQAEGGEVWGGSNTIGGSLRGSGSKLTQEDVTKLVNAALV